jgi:hypothetical protein
MENASPREHHLRAFAGRRSRSRGRCLRPDRGGRRDRLRVHARVGLGRPPGEPLHGRRGHADGPRRPGRGRHERPWDERRRHRARLVQQPAEARLRSRVLRGRRELLLEAADLSPVHDGSCVPQQRRLLPRVRGSVRLSRSEAPGVLLRLLHARRGVPSVVWPYRRGALRSGRRPLSGALAMRRRSWRGSLPLPLQRAMRIFP